MAETDNDIDFVEPERPWRHDGEGYPSEAGLSDPDPDALPESEGMAEDAVEKTVPEKTAPTSPRKASEKGLPGINEIGSHLDELRKRLIISLSVFAPLFILGMILYKELWRIVILPLNQSTSHLLRFQALGPSDGLVMSMRIAFAFALFLSLPVWLSQIWAFVAPGLAPNEKRWMYLAFGSGGVLFVVGVLIAYFLGVPYALDFLLPFNQSLDGWDNSFTGSDYVDFVITCCAGFGAAFELPLVMLALGWFGILTPEAIREWWRVVVLAVFVLAALLTPPDPFTQLLLALPMLVLFLIGYYLVKWANRHNR